jgi:hypothetical protein
VPGAEAFRMQGATASLPSRGVSPVSSWLSVDQNDLTHADPRHPIMAKPRALRIGMALAANGVTREAGAAASAGPSRCLPWTLLVQHARGLPAVPPEVPLAQTPTWDSRCRAVRACWTTPIRSSPTDESRGCVQRTPSWWHEQASCRPGIGPCASGGIRGPSSVIPAGHSSGPRNRSRFPRTAPGRRSRPRRPTSALRRGCCARTPGACLPTQSECLFLFRSFAFFFHIVVRRGPNDVVLSTRSNRPHVPRQTAARVSSRRSAVHRGSRDLESLRRAASR